MENRLYPYGASLEDNSPFPTTAVYDHTIAASMIVPEVHARRKMSHMLTTSATSFVHPTSHEILDEETRTMRSPTLLYP